MLLLSSVETSGLGRKFLESLEDREASVGAKVDAGGRERGIGDDRSRRGMMAMSLEGREEKCPFITFKRGRASINALRYSISHSELGNVLSR